MFIKVPLSRTSCQLSAKGRRDGGHPLLWSDARGGARPPERSGPGRRGGDPGGGKTYLALLACEDEERLPVLRAAACSPRSPHVRFSPQHMLASVQLDVAVAVVENAGARRERSAQIMTRGAAGSTAAGGGAPSALSPARHPRLRITLRMRRAELVDHLRRSRSRGCEANVAVSLAGRRRGAWHPKLRLRDIRATLRRCRSAFRPLRDSRMRPLARDAPPFASAQRAAIHQSRTERRRYVGSSLRPAWLPRQRLEAGATMAR